MLKSLSKLFVKHKYEILLLIFVAIYIAYFINTTFLRHDNYFTGRFDLGDMDQVLWNTLRGRIFEVTSPTSLTGVSRLSIHADFILVLLAPLYYIWRDPEMLLLIQSVVLPLGAIFIYLLSNRILKNKIVSLILSFCYLINPAVNYTNLFDFHPVTLATTFLLASFYFLQIKKYFIFILFLILAGLTKEQVWLTTALIGLYVSFMHKKKRLGLSIFTVSVLIFYFLVFRIIPMFNGGKHFALSYFSDFGNSPEEIFKNILLNPLKILQTILQKQQLIYIGDIFIPLVFLPFFSIFIIFAFPDLFINLLSNNDQLHQIYYQYSAIITPFLFISLIYSIKNVNRIIPKLTPITLSILVLIFTVGSAYEVGPLPFAKNPQIYMYTDPLPNKNIVNNYLRKIPRRLIVASTNNLGAHLSHRENIYTIPDGIDKADLILFLIRDKYDPVSAGKERDVLKKVESDPKYKQVFKNGEFVVFERIILL